METVNLPRLHLLVTEFLSTGCIITPEEVGSREPVIFGKVSILSVINVLATLIFSQSEAGSKESQFHDLPFRQAVATICDIRTWVNRMNNTDMLCTTSFSFCPQ